MRSVVLTIKPRPFVEASRAIGMTEAPTAAACHSQCPTARYRGRDSQRRDGDPCRGGTELPWPRGCTADPTWGNIISDGNSLITTNPWISLSSGLCIALAVIAFDLLGDGLRDTLDPQMRRQTGTRML